MSAYIPANLPFDAEAYADEVDAFLASQPGHRARGTPKLTPERRAELTRRLKAGEQQAALAREYGISDSYVSLLRWS